MKNQLPRSFELNSPASEVVASTAEAAFACELDGRIVAWNEAATRLLGYLPLEAVGAFCYDLLQGRDSLGGRVCDRHCPTRDMVARHEPIRHWTMQVSSASGDRLIVDISVLALSDRDGPMVLHLLSPATATQPHPWFSGRGEVVDALRSRSPIGDPAETLTPRQVEVLRWLACGATTRKIASALFISVPTTRNHIQQILNKLDAHSRLDAVCKAIQRGLL